MDATCKSKVDDEERQLNAQGVKKTQWPLSLVCSVFRHSSKISSTLGFLVLSTPKQSGPSPDWLPPLPSGSLAADGTLND